MLFHLVGIVDIGYDHLLGRGAPSPDDVKARARMNAVRHGLTAEQAVLPHEDARDYDEIRAGMIDAHTPQDSAELVLVEELANAYWRLLRLHRVETKCWEHLGGCYNRGDEGVAEALIQTPGRQMRNFFRYYGQIEKSYYRALAAVNQLKRDKGNGKSLKQQTAAAASPRNWLRFAKRRRAAPRDGTPRP